MTKFYVVTSLDESGMPISHFGTEDETSANREVKNAKRRKNVAEVIAWQHELEDAVFDLGLSNHELISICDTFQDRPLITPEHVEYYQAMSEEDEEEVVDEEGQVGPGWITFSAAARMLGVRYQQVQQKAQQGKIAREMINGRLHTQEIDIQAWEVRRARYLESRNK